MVTGRKSSLLALEMGNHVPFLLQIRTRAISAKGMTLVSPLQLLLFASKKVLSDGEIILVDDWYELPS